MARGDSLQCVSRMRNVKKLISRLVFGDNLLTGVPTLISSEGIRVQLLQLTRDIYKRNFVQLHLPFETAA
jgi:hypothetical protein